MTAQMAPSAQVALVAVCLLLCLAGSSGSQEPVVGATRWDAWTPGSEWEANLGPRQWRDRLPFYGREVGEDKVEIRADTQAVMDQEIAYAAAGGLDYWAYCFNLPTDLAAEPDEYALKLHLSSEHKDDVGFSLLLMGPGWWGPKENYSLAAEALVRYFRDSAYQTVVGGRPLLFIFYVEALTRYFGSDEATRAGLDLIRSKSVEAGLQPPLIVAQVWSAARGAECVDELGFDAISAYAWVDFSHGDAEYPYHTLAAANQAHWEACKATGKQVVPLVSAGWDTRPRWRDPQRFEELYKSPPHGPWYTQPTPQEFEDNLRAAVRWVEANPDSAGPGAIIVYAWNESDEGGWLVPTVSEGTARLDAIARVLEERGRTP